MKGTTFDERKVQAIYKKAKRLNLEYCAATVFLIAFCTIIGIIFPSLFLYTSIVCIIAVICMPFSMSFNDFEKFLEVNQNEQDVKPAEQDVKPSDQV